jgi:hypothetical protein
MPKTRLPSGMTAFRIKASSPRLGRDDRTSAARFLPNAQPFTPKLSLGHVLAAHRNSPFSDP